MITAVTVGVQRVKGIACVGFLPWLFAELPAAKQL